jgi:hypothetical protein
MRADIERWMARFPAATAFVENLYRDQRLPSGRAVSDKMRQ